MDTGRPPETSSAESLDAAALNAVDEAARAIAGLLDMKGALHLIVERVRSLVGTGHAALGTVGPDDHIQRLSRAACRPTSATRSDHSRWVAACSA